MQNSHGGRRGYWVEMPLFHSSPLSSLILLHLLVSLLFVNFNPFFIWYVGFHSLSLPFLYSSSFLSGLRSTMACSSSAVYLLRKYKNMICSSQIDR